MDKSNNLDNFLKENIFKLIKKWKGNKYNKNGELIFDGLYLNEIISGEGRLFNKDVRLNI